MVTTTDTEHAISVGTNTRQFNYQKLSQNQAM